MFITNAFMVGKVVIGALVCILVLVGTTYAQQVEVPREPVYRRFDAPKPAKLRLVISREGWGGPGASSSQNTQTYRGTGPLTNDLVGGHVMLAFNTLAPAIGNIQAGTLKVIAVASPNRVAALPNVPTVAESGLPGLDVVLYYGLAAPAGTPPAIIERLNKELRAVVNSEDIKSRIIAEKMGRP